MTPSLLSGAIVCPVRFIHFALLATLVATTSPFAAGSSPAGDEFPAVRPGREWPSGGTATVSDLPVEASSRQPKPERVPAPLPFASQSERRSPRGSALNRITILH